VARRAGAHHATEREHTPASWRGEAPDSRAACSGPACQWGLRHTDVL